MVRPGKYFPKELERTMLEHKGACDPQWAAIGPEECVIDKSLLFLTKLVLGGTPCDAHTR